MYIETSKSVLAFVLILTLIVAAFGASSVMSAQNEGVVEKTVPFKIYDSPYKSSVGIYNGVLTNNTLNQEPSFWVNKTGNSVSIDATKLSGRQLTFVFYTANMDIIWQDIIGTSNYVMNLTFHQEPVRFMVDFNGERFRTF